MSIEEIKLKIFRQVDALDAARPPLTPPKEGNQRRRIDCGLMQF